MKSYSIAVLLLVSFSVVMIAQSSKETADAHVAAARAAARQEHTSLFGLCTAPGQAEPAAQRGQAAPEQSQVPPDRKQWHAEPVKVFDNLYFVGMTEYSSSHHCLYQPR